MVLVGASVGAGAVVLVRSLRRTGWRDAWTFGGQLAGAALAAVLAYWGAFALLALGYAAALSSGA
ncbi:hypothetical protein GCM10023222_38920 [Saccharopolyspora cebuensis]